MMNALRSLFAGLDMNDAIEQFSDEELDMLTRAESPLDADAPAPAKATRKARPAPKAPAPAKAPARKAPKPKALPLTGKKCETPACGERIPAKGESGYAAARKYGPICQAARAAAKEAAREEYLAKKGRVEAKKDVRRAVVAQERAVAATQEASSVAESAAPIASCDAEPGGSIKRDSKGYPEICYTCGGFVPTGVPYAASCSKEHHADRKANGAKLTQSEIRAAKLAHPPVGQIHPQGDGGPNSRPERKTKGKRAHKHGKSPVDSAAVPIAASGAVVKTAQVPLALEIVRVLQQSDDPLAGGMLAIFRKMIGQS